MSSFTIVLQLRFLIMNSYITLMLSSFAGNLRIWNVQVIDQGTFICQADNHIGTRAAAQMNLRVLGIVFFPILRYSHPLISCTIILKSSTINILRYSLIFVEPPSIRHRPSNQIAFEGATVDFRCVSRGRDVTLRWLHNGRAVAASNNVQLTGEKGSEWRMSIVSS